MKSYAAVACIGLFGCAHLPGTSLAAKESPVIGLPLPSESGATTSPPLRINLPYSFVYHGVKIVVYSAEIASSQIQITLSLRETRGQEVKLPLSRLLQVKNSANQEFPFAKVIRDAKSLSDPSPLLTAQEKTVITVCYALPDEHTLETPLLIQFPTGKWWSSELR